MNLPKVASASFCKILTWFFGAVATLTTAGQGTTVLDQSQTDVGSSVHVYGDRSFAQIFTPSVAGFLTRLDLFANRNNFQETQPFFVSIASTRDGLPDGVLATVAQTDFDLFDRIWYSHDFSGANLSLTPSVQYAVVFSCPGSFNGITVGAAFENQYPRGAMFQRIGTTPWIPYEGFGGVNSDLMFKTYMTVPEPSTFVLASVGILVFLFLRHAKKHGLRQKMKSPFWQRKAGFLSSSRRPKHVLSHARHLNNRCFCLPVRRSPVQLSSDLVVLSPHIAHSDVGIERRRGLPLHTEPTSFQMKMGTRGTRPSTTLLMYDRINEEQFVAGPLH